MTEDKLFDIVIPAYNAHKTIYRTLSSIGCQTILDKCRITVVNDGGDSYNNIVKYFEPFMDIREIKLPVNQGSGKARQAGLDLSTYLYTTFIDADDTFNGAFVLKLIEDQLSLIEKDNNNFPDIIVSDFIEETEDGLFKTIQNDTVWMHGKFYRTKYLKENNIEFQSLRHNEDNAFNALAFTLTDNIVTFPQVTYLWHYRKDSITHINDYFFWGYKEFCIGITNSFNIIYEKFKDKKDTLEYKKLLDISANIICCLYAKYNDFSYFEGVTEELLQEYLSWSAIYYQNFYMKIEEEIPNESIQFYYQKNVASEPDHIHFTVPKISYSDYLATLKEFKLNGK